MVHQFSKPQEAREIEARARARDLVAALPGAGLPEVGDGGHDRPPSPPRLLAAVNAVFVGGLSGGRRRALGDATPTARDPDDLLAGRRAGRGW